MEDKIKHSLLQIFATKMGLLIVSFVLILIFGILGNKYEWAATVMKICWLYPIGLALVMIVYAWVINPIRDYKAKNKK